MFQILWQFETTAAESARFMEAYGPAGPWVAFFRQAPGYLGTDLFASTATPLLFLTLDRWAEPRRPTRPSGGSGARSMRPSTPRARGSPRAERFLTAWED